MHRRILPLLLLSVSAGLAALAHGAGAGEQGGDQFLDGIGETALVARYVLDGTAEDASRNQLHASLDGTGGHFIDDPQFPRVLLLTGDGSHLRLPARAIDGEDAISFSVWLFLPTAASGPLFDAGSVAASRFAGTAGRAGFRVALTSGGQPHVIEGAGSPLLENQWAHLAVVLDPGGGTLTTYVDGARTGQVRGVTATGAGLFGSTAGESDFFIGRSLEAGAPTLHARLRDIRIYRVALTDGQVRTIRDNALTRRLTQAGGGAEPTAVTAGIPAGSPLAGRLTGVADITVTTVTGILPRLPRTVPASYRGGTRGPEVRVIWPAPLDNRDVRTPGRYVVTGRVAGTRFEPRATVIVRAPVGTRTPPERLVELFPLGQVTLDRDAQRRETPFIRNRDKFLRGLAASDPDRFLYSFRDAFGQPQPPGAQALEGWDSQTTRLRGHASGHYLTALAQAYASTTWDEALQASFLRKMTRMVDTLHELSQLSGRPSTPGGPAVADPAAVPPGSGRPGYDSNLRAGEIRTDYWNWGAGFISAYPPDQFIMLERGATYGTQDSQVWAPYYTLHKILAGLLDAYEVAGNTKALEVAKGMGAWVHARLDGVPAETRDRMWNRYIAGEYGGMNEVMARLYRLTGERRFVETATLFDNTAMFFGTAAREHGLAANVDTVRGRHANQHIPQVTGALETFHGTGDLSYYLIAEHFWEIVNAGYMYSIGGVAGARRPNNAECFTAEPDTLWENGFAAGGQNETCATYNLLKLDRQLFMYDQAAKYMDHYERALYNHILASVAELDAGNTYHVPLTPGAQKRFGNARMNAFTCCNGTALESHTKLQDSIYFRAADNRTVYVNLFIPSTLHWTDRDVVLRQVTDFPYADTTRLVVQGSGRFALKVRVPEWATRGFFVRINGREEAVEAKPGAYLTLARTWRDGDAVDIRMPFAFRLEPVMDQPNVASLFYGPVLLAAEESAPRTGWRQVALDASDLSRSIAGDPATLRFEIGDAVLKPFFETYGRHSVYLHVVPK
jgi:uncharacterized protein